MLIIFYTHIFFGLVGTSERASSSSGSTTTIGALTTIILTDVRLDIHVLASLADAGLGIHVLTTTRLADLTLGVHVLATSSMGSGQSGEPVGGEGLNATVARSESGSGTGNSQGSWIGSGCGSFNGGCFVSTGTSGTTIDLRNVGLCGFFFNTKFFFNFFFILPEHSCFDGDWID